MILQEPIQAVIWECLNHYNYADAIFLAERVWHEVESDDTLFLLATCYYRAGKRSQTYTILQGRLLASSRTRYLFAKVCVELGRFYEAELTLTGGKCPNHVTDINAYKEFGEEAAYVLQLLAYIYFKAERREEGQKALLASLSINPLLWSSFEDLCLYRVPPNPNHVYTIKRWERFNSVSLNFDVLLSVIDSNEDNHTKDDLDSTTEKSTPPSKSPSNFRDDEDDDDDDENGKFSGFTYCTPEDRPYPFIKKPTKKHVPVKSGYSPFAASFGVMPLEEMSSKRNTNNKTNRLTSSEKWTQGINPTVDDLTKLVTQIKESSKTNKFKEMLKVAKVKKSAKGTNAIKKLTEIFSPVNESSEIISSSTNESPEVITSLNESSKVGVDASALTFENQNEDRLGEPCCSGIYYAKSVSDSKFDKTSTSNSCFDDKTPMNESSVLDKGRSLDAVNQEEEHDSSSFGIEENDKTNDAVTEQEKYCDTGTSSQMKPIFSRYVTDKPDCVSLNQSYSAKYRRYTRKTFNYMYMETMKDANKSVRKEDKNILHNKCTMQNKSIQKDKNATQNKNVLRDKNVPQDKIVEQKKSLPNSKSATRNKNAMQDKNLPQGRCLPEDKEAVSTEFEKLRKKENGVPVILTSEYGQKKVMHLQRKSVVGLLALFKKIAIAYRHLSAFDCEKAVECFKELPHRQKFSGSILTWIGKAYVEMHDYKTAVEYYKLVQQYEPYRVEGMELYSTALWQLQKSVDLSYLCHTLMKYDRLHAATWCVAGNCMSLEKEHDVAIKFLQRAVQLNPNFVYAYTLLGHEYIATDDLEKAAGCFRTALRVESYHYNAWYGLGSIYAKQEKYSIAAYHFKRALTLHPKSTVILCHLAVVQSALQMPYTALETINKALAINPKSALCKFHRASLHLNMNNYENALRELNELKEIAPKEALVYYLMGKVHKKLNNHHLALMCFSWATDLDPKGTNSQMKEAINDPILNSTLMNELASFSTPPMSTPTTSTAATATSNTERSSMAERPITEPTANDVNDNDSNITPSFPII